MARIKYQSRTKEYTENGAITTLVYYGTRAEMEALQDEMPVGKNLPEGRIESSRVQQGDGAVWLCEIRCSGGADNDYIDKPATEWGAKSAQLSGSMLSLPLETASGYRTNWNYFLSAAANQTVPEWWGTATDCVLDDEQAKKYAWIKSPGETPVVEGVKWKILKNPLKPGVESRDVGVYSVTETARFRSASAAGKMVANTLNRIGRPDNDFGNRGGNWKCDDATVRYNGKYWLATLTWTRSGDDAGWDEDLYN